MIFVKNSHSTTHDNSHRTHDLCIFTIFSKTGFVDMIPLCCKPSVSYSVKWSLSKLHRNHSAEIFMLY